MVATSTVIDDDVGMLMHLIIMLSNSRVAYPTYPIEDATCPY